ncbi:hypothetical protein GC174_06700 [bacterium]|nr:hypothetical protein [bacterium]
MERRFPPGSTESDFLFLVLEAVAEESTSQAAPRRPGLLKRAALELEGDFPRRWRRRSWPG